MLPLNDLGKKAMHIAVVSMYLINDEYRFIESIPSNKFVAHRQYGKKHLIYRANADLSQKDALPALRQPLSALYSRILFSLPCRDFTSSYKSLKFVAVISLAVGKYHIGAISQAVAPVAARSLQRSFFYKEAA